MIVMCCQHVGLVIRVLYLRILALFLYQYIWVNPPTSIIITTSLRLGDIAIVTTLSVFLESLICLILSEHCEKASLFLFLRQFLYL